MLQGVVTIQKGAETSKLELEKVHCLSHHLVIQNSPKMAVGDVMIGCIYVNDKMMIWHFQRVVRSSEILFNITEEKVIYKSTRLLLKHC